MQNNTQLRDTGQSSNYVAVQVQDNDMNVSSNASQLNNSGPILPSSQGSNNTFHTLQQLQILAACNAAYASHQQQENRNGGSLNPANLSTITPNPSLTVPPAFMMNFLMAASAMGFNSALGPGMGPPLPLTTLGLAAAAAAPGIKKSVSRTPGVFQHCSLRSGKWIEEEEKYAELLIELFEKGHVPNCENGCTLRSLLSLKLHCAKMRVSKKYAGKGIGKLLYNDRSKVVMTPEAKAEHESLLAKLSDAQEKFYKAAVPSPNTSTVARDGFGSFSAPQSIPGLLPITSSQNQLSGTPFTAIQPSLPISSQTASFVAPAQGRNGIEKHNSFAVSTTDSNDASNQEAAKALLEESAKLLRQSFLAAFYQSDNVTSNVKDQTDGTCANDDIRCLSTQQDNPVHFNNQPIPTRMDGSQKPVKPEGMLNYHSTLPNNNVQSERNPEAISEQHQSNSPAFTSQSSDVLHIFPGSDHISAGNCSSSSNTPKPSQFSDTTKKSTKPGSSTQTANHPLFTAESYAMFAVESAMAASQHDAYLPCFRILPGATNDLQCQHAVLRSNSIDNIDGVVNLLAEQSNQKVQRQSMEKEKRWGSHSYGFLTTERLQQGTVSYGEETTDCVSPSREDLGYTATYQGLNIKSAYVSASERSCNPSTETGSSSAVESSRDSTNSENTDASASDGGSSSESVDSCRKARRKREDTTSESDIRVMSRDAKRSRKES